MYINVNKIAKEIRQQSGSSSYTYTRVSNLLSGFKGTATKKEIQNLRKMINEEFSRIDNVLSKLLKE